MTKAKGSQNQEETSKGSEKESESEKYWRKKESGIEIYNFQFLCISINSHDSHVNDDDFHLTQDAWKYDEDVIRT